MPKNTKKTGNAPISLEERVDYDLLNRMISSRDIDVDVKTQLINYRKNIESFEEDGTCMIKVSYQPSEFLRDLEDENKGRLYAISSLSLQSFSKHIRHPLARDIYYDIDMENCHPRLIVQYCARNKIECPKMQYYVDHREEVLAKLMKHHDVDRNTAKELIISLCFGKKYEIDGVVPSAPYSFVVKLKKELKTISSEVSLINKKLRELVDKMPDKPNKPGSTLSIVSQQIENSCLMAMRDYIKSKKLRIGTFCFDGLLVEKDGIEDIDTILRECEEYVKKKTSYEIKLASKPMDYEPDFTIPDFPKYVEDDQDVVERLFKIEGKSKFVFCEGEFYTFNEKHGIYDTSVSTIYYYLKKNHMFLNVVTREATKSSSRKTMSYGRNIKLMKKIPEQMKDEITDDSWLENVQDSSRGYLLFNNGIYDFEKGKFTEGFNPDIVFFGKVPHDFPERNEEEIEHAWNLSVGQLFDDPTPMIQSIARALSGERNQKRFYMCPGSGDNGKSIFIKMVQKAFGRRGGMTGIIGGNSLMTVKGDTKDAAAKLRFLFLKKARRLLFASELEMGGTLNGVLIKSISGGDVMEGRTHQAEETEFTPQGIVFCMFNDVPKITSYDSACNKRIRYIPFNKTFLDEKDMDEQLNIVKKTCKRDKENADKIMENFYSNNKPKDDDIDIKMSKKKFIRGFIHIFLDAYHRYYHEKEVAEYDEETKKKYTQHISIDIRIKEKLEEAYEITMLDPTRFKNAAEKNNNNKDKVKCSDLSNWCLKHFGDEISGAKFEEILSKNFFLKKKKYQSMHWFGIKFRDHSYVDFTNDDDKVAEDEKKIEEEEFSDYEDEEQVVEKPVKKLPVKKPPTKKPQTKKPQTKKPSTKKTTKKLPIKKPPTKKTIKKEESDSEIESDSDDGPIKATNKTIMPKIIVKPFNKPAKEVTDTDTDSDSDTETDSE